MVVILATICIFTLRMNGNYNSLQEDNFVITNFRVNFLLRLALEELSQMYQNYGLMVPNYLE